MSTLQQWSLSTHSFPRKKSLDDAKSYHMNYYKEKELLAPFSCSGLGLSTSITPCLMLFLRLVV